jgi:hypothetical protein
MAGISSSPPLSNGHIGPNMQSRRMMPACLGIGAVAPPERSPTGPRRVHSVGFGCITPRPLAAGARRGRVTHGGCRWSCGRSAVSAVDSLSPSCIVVSSGWALGLPHDGKG